MPVQVAKETLSWDQINSMGLDELNAQIEIMAKRANARIAYLESVAAKGGILYDKKTHERIDVTPVTSFVHKQITRAGASKKSGVRFSRAKAATVQEAKRRVSILKETLDAKSTRAKEITGAERQRRQTFRDRFGLITSGHKTFKALYDLMNLANDGGFDSEQAIAIYDDWTRSSEASREFKTAEDVVSWLKTQRGGAKADIFHEHIQSKYAEAQDADSFVDATDVWVEPDESFYD